MRMKSHKSFPLWFTTISCVFLFGTPLASKCGGFKLFVDKKYGYTVRYPGHWHLRVRGGGFWIESFPKAVPVVALPPGGAIVDIVVPGQLAHAGEGPPTKMDEWVSLGTGARKVVSRDNLEISDGQRKLAITELVTQCCAVPPYQESIDWYFMIENRMFSANLLYWQGDPSVVKLRNMLKELVLSMKLIR